MYSQPFVSTCFAFVDATNQRLKFQSLQMLNPPIEWADCIYYTTSFYIKQLSIPRGPGDSWNQSPHGYWETTVFILVFILISVIFILFFNVDARIFTIMRLTLYFFWTVLFYNFHILKGMTSSKGLRITAWGRIPKS